VAEILENFDFAKRGRGPSYPYDKWFDGQIWKLEEYDDFDCKPTSLRSALYTAAQKRNLRLHTSIGKDAGGLAFVIVQAIHGEATIRTNQMYETDWSEITHIEIDEKDAKSPLGNQCWITADLMTHYDLKSAEERRDQLVSKFQTERKDSGTT
jgi:hypothetical protein